MKASKAKVKSVARKLVQASLEKDGAASAERVAAVLQALKKVPAASRKPILEAYLTQMRREEALRTLTIEHAGPLDDSVKEAIIANMSKRSGGKKLTVVDKENDALIGGLKLRLGDDEYDASLAGALAQLESA